MSLRTCLTWLTNCWSVLETCLHASSDCCDTASILLRDAKASVLQAATEARTSCSCVPNDSISSLCCLCVELCSFDAMRRALKLSSSWPMCFFAESFASWSRAAELRTQGAPNFYKSEVVSPPGLCSRQFCSQTAQLAFKLSQVISLAHDM